MKTSAAILLGFLTVGVVPLAVAQCNLSMNVRQGPTADNPLADLAPPTPEEISQQIRIDAANAIRMNTSKLKVSVAMDHQEYLPGESANVRVSAVNPTTERLEVWNPLGKHLWSIGAPYSECGEGPANTIRFLDAGEIVEGAYDFELPKVPGDYELYYSYDGFERIRFHIVGPVLLTGSGDRHNHAVVVLRPGGGRLALPSDPAHAMDVLDFYATGLDNGCGFPREFAIGGRAVEILSVDEASELPGKKRVKVWVPFDIRPGTSVPASITCEGRASNVVYIAVE